MDLYGLIGRSLSHSFSSTFFNQKFSEEHIDASYTNFEMESLDSIQEIFQLTGLNGLNVTIPYKEKIIPFLDEIDPLVEKIQSVNTIQLIRRNNGVKLKGHNTDVYGFYQLIRAYLKAYHEKALILGTGGASKAVAHVLSEYGIQVNFMSRKPSYSNVFNWDEMNEFFVKNHLLIINTTPIGMYPDIDEKIPIYYEAISSNHLVIDLIYNPKETAFLAECKNRGAVTLNGHAMLIHQALKSWEIWNQ